MLWVFSGLQQSNPLAESCQLLLLCFDDCKEEHVEASVVQRQRFLGLFGLSGPFSRSG